MTPTIHTIDAEGKKLGRIASEAAVILMGKNDASFERNKVAANKVKIVNASKLSLSEKKMNTETHNRYSGYPGGLTQETFTKVAARKGYGELLIHAIYGMLPGNKLRAKMMKNLTVTE